MIEILFYIFSFLFIWMNLYQMVHIGLIQDRFQNQNRILNFYDLLFYFSKILFLFWVILGIFISKSIFIYLIVGVFSFKFILFHLSHRHYRLYNAFVPILNIIFIVGLLISKFIY